MNQQLAVAGGRPTRSTLLPYGRHSMSAEDVDAVASVLRSDWLTTGPKVEELERAFAACVGAREAVAVSSGTAALHAAVAGLGVGPGDEVVVPALTFVASANCIVFQGARPIFADVEPDTLLLSAATAEKHLTSRTRAIVAVDYAGQPCAYRDLRELVSGTHISIVADACHSLGGQAGGRPVGTLADASAFSLHPVKAITAGEGGMVTTDDAMLAGRMRVFRNHGITTDHHRRAATMTWHYEMEGLGFNYRLSDVQSALALSQLRSLEAWIEARRRIAARYDEALGALPEIRVLATRPDVAHACHLYVIRLVPGALRGGQDAAFRALRAEGIGVMVHYPPVHLHPYYRAAVGTRPGRCPVAEAAYGEILSLPIFPSMSDADIESVIEAVHKVAGELSVVR